MKIIIAMVLIVAIVGESIAARNNEPKTLHEKAFHEKQLNIINEHWELLKKTGRITDDHVFPYLYLGSYGWYQGVCDEFQKPTPCSFGAYVFSEEAFQQAKGIYVLHGQIEGGNDLLIDVGYGAFDKDVVGHLVPYLTYCELTGGKLRHCDAQGFRDAVVIEFIDKHTVRLNKIAKWNADMYGLVLLPPDYIDMCGCRN